MLCRGFSRHNINERAVTSAVTAFSLMLYRGGERFPVALQMSGQDKQKKNALKKNLSTAALLAAFLIGLVVLLYPAVSDYVNSLHQSKVIQVYKDQTGGMDAAQQEKALQAAREYNQTLVNHKGRFVLSQREEAAYQSQLNTTEIMGYLEIDSLKVDLPIYHGTSEPVLQAGIGHFAGSSLPVGGKGTHAVLTGHRGLPSAKLLTDLDQMGMGDIFTIHVLGQALSYQVDQVLIVKPEDMAALEIDPEQDYVSLVTCTPYGINTHRLIVRGVRVDGVAANAGAQVETEAKQLDRLVVAPAVAAPMLLALLVFLLVKYRKKGGRHEID